VRIAWNRLMVITHHDVILEPGTVVKFWKSLSFGGHCTVQANAYIYGSRAGNAVSFGDYVVISPSCMVLGEAGLSIGDYTHLGPGVVVTTQYGDSRTESRDPNPVVRYSAVKIGRGCWIGIGAAIMPGAQLGDKCIVAPNSVVFGRWPESTHLSGNPARRTRRAS
jgi:acetyltransferase-like isoleucine patch superfamily enzyme